MFKKLTLLLTAFIGGLLLAPKSGKENRQTLMETVKSKMEKR